MPTAPERPIALEQPTTPFGEIVYATDPICSHCWAMEPAWRKLLYHYGQHLSVHHLYGGLLPGWDGFRDAGAGIARPADVAPHWAEVARHYGQPIDPGVWLRDPLPSSYPPSIALHAVRMLAPERETSFLRRIREALFLEARNIARPELLASSAAAEGIDAAQFEMLFHSGIAERAFRHDLEQVGRLGVRGFPTLIFRGRGGQTTTVHGTQPYARLEQALLQLTGLPRAGRAPTPDEALAAYRIGTTREFAELLGLDHGAAIQVLETSGAVRTPVAGDALWSAGAGGIV
ncbi:MAG TPA: DsbA family protein [Roseiflexaceae bacterium]|nr:DsbA family protein [Roseiflexaceae bacterium]